MVLETLGRYTFGRRLLSTFSPHPKLDPRTGELFNFGLTVNTAPRPGALAALRCYRIDTSHRLHTLATVPLPHIYINHDFGLTERYLVFVIDPLHVKHPIRMGLGRLDANAATVHETELGSLVLLVPRDGGTVRRFTIPTIAKAHVNNAFDDRGDVVIDVVRYDDWKALSAMLCNFRDYDAFKGGVLSRVRLTAANRTIVEDISTLYTEFPMHDWRRTGADYRYSYLAYNDGQRRTGIVKVDNNTGQEWQHDLASDDFPGEPIFVPRTPEAAEDDGWLLVINYLAAEHRTALVVLDARDLHAEPVAVARLPHHFMPGFHGMFTPDLRMKPEKPALSPF
ncbi:carotenoid oxygenase family protein [Nocardia takedensis]|uniref:carotenoid oxygenase family protein n=1 Tax=Nocardia takedensis TaxID=259390 RepID=UPI003F75DFDF